MLRHVTAPARSYAQIPNVILRHPRLSSDAKTLLTWQLSLPRDEKQCLSDTATHARIKKCAFQRAKRELLAEGYFHQWCIQVGGGLFATVQLISNVVLTAAEALAVRDGHQPAPGPARLTSHGPVTRPGSPTAAPPAAGEPTPRPVGRQPKKNTWENTTQPTATAPEPAPETETETGTGTGTEPEPVGRLEGECEPRPAPEPTAGPGPAQHAPASRPEARTDAEALLRSLAHTDPRLAMPARTACDWAPLAAPWLTSGLTTDQIRRTLTQGLAAARSPLGALRWRLEHALPDIPPRAPAAPRAEPRLNGMRECRTRHARTRLFTPPPGRPDENRCPACRTPQSAAMAAPEAERPGFGHFLAARRAGRNRPATGATSRRP